MIRHRHREITAKTDQRFRVAGNHCLQGFHRIVTMSAWSDKTEHAFEVIQKLRTRFFGNADGTVALHVRVTAQRADPSPRFADIAAHQQKVGNQPDVRGAFVMLGDPHAIGHDSGVGFGVGNGNALQIVAG